jgi:hypothetical protein
LPDLQVFDGARVDYGEAGQGGKWTIGAFLDSALATPFFAGSPPDGNPMLLAGCAFKRPVLGQIDAYLLGSHGLTEDPLLGFHWQQAPAAGAFPVIHKLDFAIRPDAGAEDSLPWHFALHRQSEDWTWHLGAEHVEGEGDGPRVSATPGTFRYLPGGPDSDSLNLFAGFDCRLSEGIFASMTVQQMWDEETGEASARILETALRRQLLPAVSLLGGTGLGYDSSSGEAFLRGGLQVTAAF